MNYRVATCAERPDLLPQTWEIGKAVWPEFMLHDPVALDHWEETQTAFPEIDIEEYVTWRCDDGLPFDPWLRVHHRLGAKIIGICNASMKITGSVADWRRWTGKPLPETGRYTIAGALVPVKIDLASDRGIYVEPNVWMPHACADGADNLVAQSSRTCPQPLASRFPLRH